jgi:hypothetical protein
VRATFHISCAALLLVLAACGDGPPAAAPAADAAAQVPAAALESPQALAAWAAAQPTSDSAAPFDVDKLVLPTSDNEGR